MSERTVAGVAILGPECFYPSVSPSQEADHIYQTAKAANRLPFPYSTGYIPPLVISQFARGDLRLPTLGKTKSRRKSQRGKASGSKNPPVKQSRFGQVPPAGELTSSCGITERFPIFVLKRKDEPIVRFNTTTSCGIITDCEENDCYLDEDDDPGENDLPARVTAARLAAEKNGPPEGNTEKATNEETLWRSPMDVLPDRTRKHTARSEDSPVFGSQASQKSAPDRYRYINREPPGPEPIPRRSTHESKLNTEAPPFAFTGIFIPTINEAELVFGCPVCEDPWGPRIEEFWAVYIGVPAMVPAVQLGIPVYRL